MLPLVKVHAAPHGRSLGAGVRFGVLRLRSCKTGRDQGVRSFDMPPAVGPGGGDPALGDCCSRSGVRFILFALRVSMNRGCGLLFAGGGCVDYWWIGTTRASDSAVLSRCCMVPACAARRIRVCKGRSAICGRSPLFRLRPVVYYFSYFRSQSVGQTKT